MTETGRVQTPVAGRHMQELPTSQGIDHIQINDALGAGPSTAEALADLNAEYGYTILSAVRSYAVFMREEAKAAQTAYEAIKSDPARRDAQDRTLVTTKGLMHSAAAFREAAHKADLAADAWEALRDRLEDEDA